MSFGTLYVVSGLLSCASRLGNKKGVRNPRGAKWGWDTQSRVAAAGVKLLLCHAQAWSPQRFVSDALTVSFWKTAPSQVGVTVEGKEHFVPRVPHAGAGIPPPCLPPGYPNVVAFEVDLSSRPDGLSPLILPPSCLGPHRPTLQGNPGERKANAPSLILPPPNPFQPLSLK